MDETKRRVAALLLCTGFGILVGVSGDVFLAGRTARLQDVLIAIAASPLVVTIGGKAVSIPSLADYFLVGGLAFWPVYALLAWRSIAKGRCWIWVAIVLWTSQGFFQIVSRFDMVMSA